MKTIVLYVSERSFFVTHFVSKQEKTSQLFELSHIEMLRSIFEGAKADLWVIKSNNDLLKCQVIEALQMIGAKFTVLAHVENPEISTKKQKKEFLNAMLAESAK
jgi:hypothetical protein